MSIQLFLQDPCRDIVMSTHPWLLIVCSNSLEEKSGERAIQLAGVLTKLGPTFIKVGQSLSIRTDLLSPAYVRGLQTLQDQVPAFHTGIAIGNFGIRMGFARCRCCHKHVNRASGCSLIRTSLSCQPKVDGSTSGHQSPASQHC